MCMRPTGPAAADRGMKRVSDGEIGRRRPEKRPASLVALRWVGGAGPLRRMLMLRTLALAAVAAFLAAGPAAGAQSRGHDTTAPAVCTGSCFAPPTGPGPLLGFSRHRWGHGVRMQP